MAHTAPRSWFDGHADGSNGEQHSIKFSKEIPLQERRLCADSTVQERFQITCTKVRRASIDQLAEHPILKDINDSDVLIYTERSIISKDATVRPDLLIKAGNKITVVDYKTGLEKPEHQEQLNRYIELLSAVLKQ